MKANIDQPVLDHKGKPLPLDPAEAQKPEDERKALTYRDLFEQALLFGADEKEFEENRKVKADRFALWRRLGNVLPDAEVEFTSEDVTLIKRLVDKSYSVLVHGRVVELLDPAALAPSKPRGKATVEKTA